MSERITCKVHDHEQRVVKVGVEGVVYPMMVVWNSIHAGHKYHTQARGLVANVEAVERHGRRYLTTHPDRITDNNLDELPACV